MTRLDRARLDAAEFPVRFEVQTRFDDTDMQGHLNNAAVVVLLQEARVDFNRQAGLWDHGKGLRMMAVGITVEFAGEMFFPERVEIFSGTTKIGRSSYTLAQVARQGGTARIYAEATMVFADENGPTAIPDPIRAALERMMLPQPQDTSKS